MSRRSAWRRLATLVLTVLVAVSLAGCLDPFRPRVDEAVLSASEHEWVVKRLPRENGGVFGPDLVQTEYRFDPAGSGAPYPGLLVLVGIRSITRGDSDDLLARTHEILDETLVAQGVMVDDGQSASGKRTLANGAQSQWFRIVGSSEANSPLFANEEEVRAFGETWYDGKSSTNIIAIALAQTTGTGGLFGETTIRNHAVWNELVGDPSGTAGATHERGFIYHVVSHD